MTTKKEGKNLYAAQALIGAKVYFNNYATRPAGTVIGVFEDNGRIFYTISTDVCLPPINAPRSSFTIVSGGSR
jgi:hypothetical protein